MCACLSLGWPVLYVSPRVCLSIPVPRMGLCSLERGQIGACTSRNNYVGHLFILLDNRAMFSNISLGSIKGREHLKNLFLILCFLSNKRE